MAETVAHGYSSESTQRVLCYEYHHDRVKMILKYLCALVLRTKVASALEGLISIYVKSCEFLMTCVFCQLLEKCGLSYRQQKEFSWVALIVFKVVHKEISFHSHVPGHAVSVDINITI